MTFGKIIHEKRIAKNESTAALARKLKISESFVKHLEYSNQVPVSPRLVRALSRHYRISLAELEILAAKRNRIGKRYYREYRKKTAA